MSIKGIVDTCVHFQSFRNIDLFEQGLYMLCIAVTSPSEGPATPLLLEACVHSAPPVPKHQVNPAHLEDFRFFTRSFLVKYTDEEVETSDLAVFRSEIDRAAVDSSLVISVNLLFAETQVGLEEQTLLRQPPPLDAFCLVGTCKLKVANPLYGANQFVSVQFSGRYPCQANFCLHVIQLDFRYRFAGRTQSTDLDKLTAELMFPGLETLTDQDVDMAHNLWVRHLTRVHQRTQQLLRQVISNSTCSDAIHFLPASIHEGSTRFSESCQARDPVTVARQLVDEIQTVSELLHSVEHNLLAVVKRYATEVTTLLQREYVQKLRDHWGGCTFRDLHLVSTLAESSPKSAGQDHTKIAVALRKTPLFADTAHFDVHQLDYFAKSKVHPVLFQDIFHLGQPPDPHAWSPDWFSFTPHFKRTGVHLLVLVHGFQGSAFDVKLIKNSIAALRPDCMILCSSVNEGRTDGDIGEMGHRLALEVFQYIKEWCPRSALAALSFIGHSLGGLIIRAALPYLHQFAEHFHLFLTLSTPHLGYMSNASAVVGAGMWLMKKWMKSLCLKQLGMSETYELRQSFLYKLSQANGLETFKHVAFVSSFQDAYVPFESARVEVNAKVVSDKTRGSCYMEMANNIISHLSCSHIYRLDVSYKPKKQSFDNLIGRHAHIEMLENTSILQMILFSCAHFFAI